MTIDVIFAKNYKKGDEIHARFLHLIKPCFIQTNDALVLGIFSRIPTENGTIFYENLHILIK